MGNYQNQKDKLLVHHDEKRSQSEKLQSKAKNSGSTIQQPLKKKTKTSTSIGSNASSKTAKEVKIFMGPQKVAAGIKISKPTFNVQINNNVTNNNTKPQQMINPVQFV